MLKNGKETPIISFCIPTYNRASCVEQCVKWILEYPGNNIEIIVSDNFSSDNTKERLLEIADTRMKYFRNDRNEGFAYNLDKVLQEASGEFCFLLSDEDEVNIEKISTLIEIIKSNSNLAIIFGLIQSADSSGNTWSGYGSTRLQAGEQAVEKMSFKHPYLSGIIVNRNIYVRSIRTSKHWYHKDLFYPHECLVFLLAFHGDILVIEDTIVFTHSYGNITYSGNKGISNAYSFEGRLQTCKDRTRIINDNIDNKKLKEKLMLDNFRHMMTAATAGEYMIFTGENKNIFGVNNKKENLQIAISEFVDEFNKFISCNKISLSKNFKYNIKKQCVILRLKVIGINFYGSSIYKKAKMVFDRL